ncbi:late competence protein comgb, access of dna to comea [Liquorilactobacillus capillatus DSM 19910]|uniref:Late competence protein comgb, access of dna to comea n=1 Tax=Liquorilactobacillus capillatus DSM 19910 TaxID=1423731 RepID=A0A0R1M3U1_9LACO|nr:late competence protein comgb, access of dna to comea [Liquorilactobacillus capillatus DSM 19910]
MNAGFSLQQALLDVMIFLPEYSDILNNVHNKLLDGETLSTALKPYVKESVFNQIYIAEKHGKMSESIKQVGRFLERRIEQTDKLRAVLMYPVMLFIMLGGLMVAIQVWLRPELIKFQDLQNLNNVARHNYVYLLSIGTLVILLTIYLLQVREKLIKKTILARQEWYCHLPVFGVAYQYYCHYYITFNFGLLLKSGLDIKEICDFLVSFDDNSLMAQFGQELKRNLLTGNDYTYFISKYDFIPTEMTLFMGKGGTLAELSSELLFFSEITYEKLIRKIDRLINYVQPLMFLVIAVIIILMYLSILMPLYNNLGGMYQ